MANDPPIKNQKSEITNFSAHIPVLLQPVLKLLDPQPGQTLLDATVGLAGHACAIAARLGPAGRIIGLDVDPANLAAAEKNLSVTGVPFKLYRMNFGEILPLPPPSGRGVGGGCPNPPPSQGGVGEGETVANHVGRMQSDALPETVSAFRLFGVSAFDLLLADLGISSSQLDSAQRGLSFQQDGPLDMRLDDRIQATAADLVNRLPEPKLADLIYEYGQEHASRRIARAIAKVRQRTPIQRTGELADLVCRALGVNPDAWRPGRIHPATRTFQALRIAVNDEMGALERLLEALPQLLRPGGRAGIISFHSLEDGRVKRAFKAGEKAGLLKIITPKPVEADDAEIALNPRSRSAKLRVAERTAVSC